MEMRVWGEITVRLSYDPEKLLGPDEEEAYEAIWDQIEERLDVFIRSEQPAGDDLKLEVIK